ncbi:class I SAM-dependent methyltransferase [Oxalobacteraceae bacterium]|nr:class I SAM-dependent methyltransferase [Oxalobacteraceae bacterium]
MITNEMGKYYALSAATYDAIYEQEERQDDLDELHELVADLLEGHTVLELACGSGYWTETIAEVAESVHATDFCPEMLALAAERGLDEDIVRFSQLDAHALPEDIGSYTAVFAAGWWSHVKREDQERYLKHLRARLGKDTLLVLLDSTYVDGSSTVIARTDLEGNTFQIRMAADGQRYEVLKNYPTDSALRKKLATAAREIRVERMEYYYLASGRLK